MALQRYRRKTSLDGVPRRQAACFPEALLEEEGKGLRTNLLLEDSDGKGVSQLAS